MALRSGPDIDHFHGVVGAFSMTPWWIWSGRDVECVSDISAGPTDRYPLDDGDILCVVCDRCGLPSHPNDGRKIIRRSIFCNRGRSSTSTIVKSSIYAKLEKSEVRRRSGVVD